MPVSRVDTQKTLFLLWKDTNQRGRQGLVGEMDVRANNYHQNYLRTQRRMKYRGRNDKLGLWESRRLLRAGLEQLDRSPQTALLISVMTPNHGATLEEGITWQLNVRSPELESSWFKS